VYGAVLVPAVVLAVWVASLVTNTVFIRPDFYDGAMWPLIVTAPGAVIGVLLFLGIARITASLERLSRPKKLDHIRRCALLYAALVFVVGWAAISYSPAGSNYAFSLQLQVLAVVLTALLADALVLFTKNRANSTNDAGGET
jgi:predicted Abi (CAAX) family protease